MLQLAHSEDSDDESFTNAWLDASYPVALDSAGADHPNALDATLPAACRRDPRRRTHEVAAHTLTAIALNPPARPVGSGES